MACMFGFLSIVRILLDRGAEINCCNAKGITPLMEAAAEGHLEVVKLLVDRGANLEASTGAFHDTALTFAFFNGKLTSC